MVGMYLIALASVTLLFSASWEYYTTEFQDDLGLDIDVETTDGQINRSDLPPVGSEETSIDETISLVQIGYGLSFILGIAGLALYLVV